jgi:hypothetical protein
MGTFRFRVAGTVREESSARPLANLLVRAYDEDLLVDDHLGDATTDENGRFDIRFTELAFRDAFEKSPDVYLRIFDPTGEIELYSTRSQVRRDARGQEHFEIRVPAGLLADARGDAS